MQSKGTNFDGCKVISTLMFYAVSLQSSASIFPQKLRQNRLFADVRKTRLWFGVSPLNVQILSEKIT